MNCTKCDLAVPSDARFCPGCGQPLAPDSLRDLRVVTVLTARAGLPEELGALDAETFRQVLEAFYLLVEDAVGTVGGTVESLAGPVAVARFGAPISRVDDPQCAASAARRIAAGSFSAGPGLEIRSAVGLATGVVMAGLDTRPGGGGQYAIRGEPVEASRELCQAAAPGEVLVDGETVQRASELFSFEAMPPTKANGRERQTFRLAGPAGHGMESLHGAIGPLFGRDAERLKIEGSALAAIGGASQVIAIAGPEGLGKSRLAGEAWAQVRGRTKARLLLARAFSFHTDAPYRLAAYLLETWAGLEEADMATRLGRLREWAAGLGRPEPERSAERLKWLFGGRSDGIASPAIEREMCAELTACVLSAARCEPLVMVLEDLQRADPASLAWVQALLRAAAAEPLQLLVVLTGTELPEMDVPPGVEVTRIWIRPLSNQSALALFGCRLGLGDPVERWPVPIRNLGQELVRKAGGNPFFLSELVRTLISAGILARRQGEWVVQPGATGVGLPPTLKGSVAAKLDRLNPETRRLLGIAAALGSTFDTSSLMAVSQADPTSALRRLVYEGLIDPLDADGMRHAFQQEVYRDAAYQALLPADRAAVHGRIAVFLEESCAERLDEFAGVIADHHARAGDFARALSFAYHAATAALQAGSFREALRRYRQALDLHGRVSKADLPVSLEALLEELVEAEEAQGEFREALLHARELLALAGQDEAGRRLRMRTLRRIGAIQERRGQFDEALEALGEGLDLARAIADPGAEAALQSAMGTIELRRGRLEEVVRLSQEALGALARLGDGADPGDVAYAHSLLGIAYYRMAVWESSIAHHRKALTLREESRDIPGTLRSLNNLGNTYVDCGRFSQAEKLYRQALALARKAGGPQDLAMVLNNLGHLQMLRGEFALADRHFEESAALARQTGDERSLGIALVNRGLAQTELRQYAEARASLESGHARLEAIGSYEQHVEVLVALGRIALEEGDAVRAWKFFHRARFHAAEARQPHLEALAHRAVGEYHLRLGSLEAAIGAFTDAVQAHGDRSHPLEAARSYRMLARALEAADRGPEAAEAMAVAGRLLEGLEVPRDLAGIGPAAT